MKKRIGTITFHCSYNYGSVLQAYALQQVLLSNGFENQIIHYFSDDFEQYRLIPHKLTKKSILSLARTILFFPRFIKRRDSFMRFWRNRLLLTPKYTDWRKLRGLNDQFDVFLCGSDQIWNLDCTNGVEPAFFLQFCDKGKRKVAFAPSLAKTDFRKNYDAELREALKSFDFIAVREPSTVQFISERWGRQASVVLDPTLLLPVEHYPVEVPTASLPEDGYIFAYILGANREIVRYCNQFSSELGLPVYYISANEGLYVHRHLRGVDVFGASPEEFLYYIQNARYVISTSFHATVFSVLFEKPFCTFQRGTVSSRMIDFLDSLGLSERVYHDGFRMEDAIDYAAVKERLRPMQEASKEFLFHALS